MLPPLKHLATYYISGSVSRVVISFPGIQNTLYNITSSEKVYHRRHPFGVTVLRDSNCRKYYRLQSVIDETFSVTCGERLATLADGLASLTRSASRSRSSSCLLSICRNTTSCKLDLSETKFQVLM